MVLLVSDLKVDSFVDQKLDHVDLVVFYRVIHWRLTIVVNVVHIRAKRRKFLRSCSVPLTNAVEYWSLAIRVDLVQVEPFFK